MTSTAAQLSLPSEIHTLWDTLAPQVEAMCTAAKEASVWKRTHPGTSAHHRIATTIKRGEVQRLADGLIGALGAHIPPVCLDQRWGLRVRNSCDSAHWNTDHGKGRKAYASNVRFTPTALGAFLGKIVAAGILARQAVAQPCTLGTYALLEPHDTKGPARAYRDFHHNTVKAMNPMDAIAHAVVSGIFQPTTKSITAHQAFLRAAQDTLLLPNTALVSEHPTLVERLLAHPLVGILNSYAPGTDQREFLSRNRPSTTTPLDTTGWRDLIMAHNTALRTLLAFLDTITPPFPGQASAEGWRVLHQPRYSAPIAAWSKESAAAIFILDTMTLEGCKIHHPNLVLERILPPKGHTHDNDIEHASRGQRLDHAGTVGAHAVPSGG